MNQARLFVFLALTCLVVLTHVSDTKAQGLRWGRTMQDESNGIMDERGLPNERNSGKYWDDIFPQRVLRKRFLAKKNAGKICE